MNTSPAEVLSTDSPSLFEAAVERAAGLLRGGGLVALPTETVYGLAANAFDADAVAKIFDVKGRPAHNPVIVHVSGVEMARRCVSAWPDRADALARAFWPGPLTIVLSRSGAIPDIVTAGGDTVGVRWPNHPFIQAVIRACDFPLAAPSANPAAGVSPTSAEHVRKSLGSRIPLIVDGGPSQIGIESTVIDLAVEPPRVLRPGMIHEESLRAVTGELGTASAERGATARSPGLLERHYSPRADLLILSWRDDADLDRQLLSRNVRPAAAHVIAHSRIPSAVRFARVSVIPHDAEAFARALYAELHRCDEEGATWIVMEAVPAEPNWRAIADRLARAAA
jgi:L-threonylcarbamoyladenylate synthase